MQPLTDEEAVDLIQSNCERQIMEDLAAHNLENVHMMDSGMVDKKVRRRDSIVRPRGGANKPQKPMNIYQYLMNDKNF